MVDVTLTEGVKMPRITLFLEIPLWDSREGNDLSSSQSDYALCIHFPQLLSSLQVVYKDNVPIPNSHQVLASADLRRSDQKL